MRGLCQQRIGCDQTETFLVTIAFLRPKDLVRRVPFVQMGLGGPDLAQSYPSSILTKPTCDDQAGKFWYLFEIDISGCRPNRIIAPAI